MPSPRIHNSLPQPQRQLKLLNHSIQNPTTKISIRFNSHRLPPKVQKIRIKISFQAPQLPWNPQQLQNHHNILTILMHLAKITTITIIPTISTKYNLISRQRPHKFRSHCRQRQPLLHHHHHHKPTYNRLHHKDQLSIHFISVWTISKRKVHYFHHCLNPLPSHPQKAHTILIILKIVILLNHKRLLLL